MPTYRLPDEPRPSRWSHLSVNPVWPLLGLMLGGSWLAWPWFAVNAFAVGSPTRKRELGLVVLGFLGAVGLTMGLILLSERNALRGRTAVRFAVLAVILWKLAVAYFLHALQARSFGLYQYYGGRVRNGIPVAIAGALLRGPVLNAIGAGFWLIVLA